MGIITLALRDDISEAPINEAPNSKQQLQTQIPRAIEEIKNSFNARTKVIPIQISLAKRLQCF